MSKSSSCASSGASRWSSQDSGRALTLLAQIADDEDPPEMLEAVWSIDGSPLDGTPGPELDGSVAATTWLLPGDHQVELVVTDLRGFSTTASAAFEITSSCPDTLWWRDEDDDDAGDLELPVAACAPPADFVDNASDCGDSNPSIHLGTPEICDGLDNDCDSQPDEGLYQAVGPEIVVAAEAGDQHAPRIHALGGLLGVLWRDDNGGKALRFRRYNSELVALDDSPYLVGSAVHGDLAVRAGAWVVSKHPISGSMQQVELDAFGAVGEPVEIAQIDCTHGIALGAAGGLTAHATVHRCKMTAMPTAIKRKVAVAVLDSAGSLWVSTARSTSPAPTGGRTYS